LALTSADNEDEGEDLFYGQRTDGAEAEAEELAKGMAREAAIEDDAYERLIAPSTDMTREIMKGLVVDRYVQDLEEGERSTTGAVEGEADRQETEVTLHRSISQPDLGSVSWPDVPVPSDVNVPGGFRREYVLNERFRDIPGDEGGHEVFELPEIVQTSFLDSLLESNSALLFAWVDDGLNSDEEDSSSEYDSDVDSVERLMEDGEAGDGRSPARLQMVFSSYGKRSIARRNSDYQNDESKKASNGKTVLTLVKCFIATGVLFLPNAFKSAGLFAGAFTILCVGFLSLLGMEMLLKTRDHIASGLYRPPTPSTPLLSEAASRHVTTALFPRKRVEVNTYSQVGGQVLGKKGKKIVDLSILLTQIGFCCVYISFTGNSISQALAGGTVTDPEPIAPLWAFMVAPVPIIIPLTLIRYLKHFAIPNLIANVFVFASLLYIMIQTSVTLVMGRSPANWACGEDETLSACFYINWGEYLTFLGSSVYVFEGVTMVIPIQNSMIHREALPKMLFKVLSVITVLFCIFGALNFYTYGQNTEPIIINNMPQIGKLAVTAMFSLVAVFMFPLMAFPAARIIEKRLFKKMRRSGKKWQKNFIRSCIVMFCLFVSIIAGAKVDKLVAVIGGLFCVPLAMVFPPLFYLRSGAATSFEDKVAAFVLLLLGVSATILSSSTAIIQF